MKNELFFIVFPVLAQILAELKLLTTIIGEIAMAITPIGNGPDCSEYKSHLIWIWILLSGVAFVAFTMLVIRPTMKWVAHRCSPEQDNINEAYIYLTLAEVMVYSFMTDLIGFMQSSMPSYLDWQFLNKGNLQREWSRGSNISPYPKRDLSMIQTHISLHIATPKPLLLLMSLFSGWISWCLSRISIGSKQCQDL